MLMGEEGVVGRWGAEADIAHLSLGHMPEMSSCSAAAGSTCYSSI